MRQTGSLDLPADELICEYAVFGASALTADGLRMIR